MLISEILNKKVDYQVVRETDSIFHTRAEINGRIINFSGIEENGEWELEFGEKLPNGKVAYGKTGSGGELEVFSMVKDSILELIARYQPQILFFTADKDGGTDTRGNVYERMIKRFKVPGYTYSRQTHDNHDRFELVRN